MFDCWFYELKELKSLPIKPRNRINTSKGYVAKTDISINFMRSSNCNGRVASLCGLVGRVPMASQSKQSHRLSS